MPEHHHNTVVGIGHTEDNALLLVMQWEYAGITSQSSSTTTGMNGA